MNDGKNKKIDHMFVVAEIISELLDFDQSTQKWYSFKFSIFLLT